MQEGAAASQGSWFPPVGGRGQRLNDSDLSVLAWDSPGSGAALPAPPLFLLPAQ